MLTCVRVPQGHLDAQPALEEEADLLGVQCLPDGREPLKGEQGRWSGDVPCELGGNRAASDHQEPRNSEVTLPGPHKPQDGDQEEAEAGR